MTCAGTLKEDFKHCSKHLWDGVRRQLRGHKRSHWFTVVILIAVGTVVGHELGKYNMWIDVRYSVYQLFSQRVTLRNPYPKRTVMVLIGDEEFWNGDLAHRIPLKRDYLAALMLKVDEANPEVIALDVELSLPSPATSPTEHPAYESETSCLLEVVSLISKKRTVVLAKAVKYANEEKTEYVPEASVYDGYPFEGKGLRTGYISLPRDIRRVALALKMKDGEPLNSFAAAIAGAVDERSLKEIQRREKDALPYGTFIKPDDFVRLSADEVLKATPTELKEKLAFKIVIVGGAWHRDGFNRGPMHDGHLSPVGNIYGAFVHANYAEALLGSRTYEPVREWVATSLEVAFSVVLALIFSLHIRLALKLAVDIFLCVFVIGVSYVSWQNLGLFFDFFIPVVLLFVHALIETKRE